MLKTIEQSVYFAASPARVYRMYVNAREHAAFSGGSVKLEARPGGKFEAFGGMIWGKMLALVPGKLIVQQWRSVYFKKDDLDSTLILTFDKQGKGCRLHLVHVNVAKQDYLGVKNGWPKYYWGPMKAYLRKALRH